MNCQIRNDVMYLTARGLNARMVARVLEIEVQEVRQILRKARKR